MVDPYSGYVAMFSRAEKLAENPGWVETAPASLRFGNRSSRFSSRQIAAYLKFFHLCYISETQMVLKIGQPNSR